LPLFSPLQVQSSIVASADELKDEWNAPLGCEEDAAALAARYFAAGHRFRAPPG
jgi:hypothetical protein